MTMLSTWPSVAIVALAIAILSAKRAFAFLDAPPSAHAHRLDSIDGLRGILASAVFFHHFLMYSYDSTHGASGLPPSRFYSFIGPGAVAVFFMITGYLFWGRLIDKKGSIKWLEMFINRIFRVYPLYLFLILSYFAWSIGHAGLTSSQEPNEIASQVLQWLALGAVDHPDPFLGHPEYLGVVGQTWSLHYEWLFYLSLPVLAVFSSERSAVAVTGCSLLFVIFGGAIAAPYNFFTAHFLIGMFTASVMRSYPHLCGDGPIRSILMIAAMAGAISFSNTPYATGTTIMLGLFFLLVASGASAFGVLTTYGAKRLGNMSYSLYLMHGLIINLIVSIEQVRYHIKHSDMRFWVVTSILYAVVVASSSLTFLLIEKTGIHVGRNMIIRLTKKNDHVASRDTA